MCMMYDTYVHAVVPTRARIVPFQRQCNVCRPNGSIYVDGATGVVWVTLPRRPRETCPRTEITYLGRWVDTISAESFEREPARVPSRLPGLVLSSSRGPQWSASTLNIAHTQSSKSSSHVLRIYIYCIRTCAMEARGLLLFRPPKTGDKTSVSVAVVVVSSRRLLIVGLLACR